MNPTQEPTADKTAEEKDFQERKQQATKEMDEVLAKHQLNIKMTMVYSESAIIPRLGFVDVKKKPEPSLVGTTKKNVSKK